MGLEGADSNAETEEGGERLTVQGSEEPGAGEEDGLTEEGSEEPPVGSVDI